MTLFGRPPIRPPAHFVTTNLYPRFASNQPRKFGLQIIEQNDSSAKCERRTGKANPPLALTACPNAAVKADPQQVLFKDPATGQQKLPTPGVHPA